MEIKSFHVGRIYPLSIIFGLSAVYWHLIRWRLLIFDYRSEVAAIAAVLETLDGQVLLTRIIRLVEACAFHGHLEILHLRIHSAALRVSPLCRLGLVLDGPNIAHEGRTVTFCPQIVSAGHRRHFGCFVRDPKGCVVGHERLLLLDAFLFHFAKFVCTIRIYLFYSKYNRSIARSNILLQTRLDEINWTGDQN